MKFWKWVNVANIAEGEPVEERALYLDGVIAEESWFNDEVTPAEFRAELESGKGDIVVWINSPGGDVFAAAQIYNMLKEYKGNVTVKIDALAASAASVIAMAGDTVIVSPVSMLMIHNPATFAMGDHNEMEKTIAMLDEVKNSIINAYHAKTGLSKNKLSQMMEDETWINAKKAVELGFADKIAYGEGQPEDEQAVTDSMMFGRKHFVQQVTNKVRSHYHVEEPETRDAAELYARLKSMKDNF